MRIWAQTCTNHGQLTHECDNGNLNMVKHQGCKLYCQLDAGRKYYPVSAIVQQADSWISNCVKVTITILLARMAGSNHGPH